MEKAKISVIVPVYNAEKFLDACIQSILQQSFQKIELILVDDGSKDSSCSICEKYAGLDSRVRFIHQENAGSSAAKNAGMAKAEGDYIAFADADDTLDTQYLEHLYAGVEANADVDVCIGNAAFTRVRGEEVLSRRTVALHGGMFTLKAFMEYYPEYMPNAIIGAPWNKLYKRTLLQQYAVEFDTSIRNNEDTHFNYLYLSKCKTVYVSETPYYNYMNRVGVESASKRYIENLFEIYVLTYHKALDFLKATGTLEENAGFQKQYFIGLVIGALNGIAGIGNGLSRKEKLQKMQDICQHPDVGSAVRDVRFPSAKKQMAVRLLQAKQAHLLYMFFTANQKFGKGR